ncbi:hypothetical protein HNR19_000949 [Nocardioides thalensis]|uniref:Uncharacterized protein n=1 Tax=Nocardioides thalensis TaxID=1914755 RepID=A0A853BZ73_9ACTN|nr:hypothetical protein [Nocardioides thalensis]NYJ00251.1 hypothetical protein [Nocardioides thalensis]
MTDSLDDLYEEVGRVVVPGAVLEQALTSIAYGALGGGDAAREITHGLPLAQVQAHIETEAKARPAEWWSARSLDLLTRIAQPLQARHRVVHGYWTDLRGIVDGKSFVTFKPDRQSRMWQAQHFDGTQLRALASELRDLSLEAREIADRLIDEVEGR